MPFNAFDVTKVFPQKEFPLRRVGKIILNENPENYFAQIEQVAFSPAHMPPGIEASPDKMLQVIHNSCTRQISFTIEMGEDLFLSRVACLHITILIYIVLE